MSQKNEWPPEKLAAAVELWASGRSMKEIEEHLGVSHGALHGKMGRRRDLFTPRPSSRAVWTPERLDQAVELWNAGLSKEAIAVQLGVTWKAFAHIVEDKKYRERFPRRLLPKQWPTPPHKLVEYAPPPPPQPKQQESTPQPEHRKPTAKPTRLAPATKPVVGYAPPDRCQFILSADGPPWRFCGAVRHADRPYCEQHCRICYVPPSNYSQARANQEQELARVFATKRAA